MSTFEFVDQIPHERRRGAKPDPLITEFAAALRANPGRWAKWPKKQTTPSAARSLASRINCRAHGPVALAPSGFEAGSRGDVVYVRFIGGAA